MSRKRRLTGNLVAGLLGKFVLVGRQLILVPFFLSMWGAEYYGDWLILSSIPTILAMSNVGLGTAASTQIVLAIGARDEQEANRLLASALMFVFAASVMVLTPLALVAYTGSGLFQSVATRVQYPGFVVLLLFAGLAVSMLGQPWEGYWIARQKAAQAMFAGVLFSIIDLVGAASVLVAGGDALIFALVSFALRVGWTLAYIGYSFSLTDKSYPMSPSLLLLRRLLGRGIGFQLSGLWQAVLFQGSLFVAQSVLGAAGTATWGTVRTLSRSGNQLLALTNQTLMPELQNAIAAKDFVDARKLHAFGLRIALVVGGLVAGALSFGGGWAYQLWTNDALQVPPSIWPITGICVLLNSVWWTSSLVHRSMNQPWYMNLWGLIAAVIAVTVMAILGLSYGIVGFALGAVVFELIMAVAIPRRSHQLLQERTTPQVESVVPAV